MVNRGNLSCRDITSSAPSIGDAWYLYYMVVQTTIRIWKVKQALSKNNQTGWLLLKYRNEIKFPIPLHTCALWSELPPSKITTMVEWEKCQYPQVQPYTWIPSYIYIGSRQDMNQFMRTRIYFSNRRIWFEGTLLDAWLIFKPAHRCLLRKLVQNIISMVYVTCELQRLFYFISF